VRRLIAPAGSLTNHERMNVARRVLVGLHAAGIRRVWYLPDRYQLIEHAAESVPEIDLVPALATATDTPEDTLRATEAMVQAGVKVLVTHGGDGTNRLVAAAAAEVPILPLAAGTNNVFPGMVEATSAGFAAGVLAAGAPSGECVQRHKCIRVEIDDWADLALVDAAVLRDETVGSRAVWDPDRVVACMVTRAVPGAVGLSGLAGALVNILPTEPRGAWVELGAGTRIVALIAPGRATTTEVRAIRTVGVGQKIETGPISGTITLDGERQRTVRGEIVCFTLENSGPWVVDVSATLAWAQAIGAFRV
jgi:predicted polyphosphate/ATP-dependent NAD kinase